MDKIDVDQLITDLREALDARDPYRLRQLYGKFSELSIIKQDREIIELAIISYAFNKIFLKVHYHSKYGDLLSRTIQNLDNKRFEIILAEIKEFDRKHGFFQGNIVKKGRIKVGSRLYNGGISLARAAELVSVRVTDILKYSGGTQVHETNISSIHERLENARRALN